MTQAEPVRLRAEGPAARHKLSSRVIEERQDHITQTYKHRDYITYSARQDQGKSQYIHGKSRRICRIHGNWQRHTAHTARDEGVVARHKLS